MLRIVLDVNVLVSAMLSPSSIPGRIVGFWRQGDIELVASLEIIDKTIEVPRRPHIVKVFPIDEADLQDLRTLLIEESLLTPHILEVKAVEQDPEDDAIIIAAIEGKADCIVSGDRHLKNMGSYEMIPILSPAEFLLRYNLS